MLSFGGLLSEVLQGGAAGLTASNPGIVKILGGFVFPVGLVMCVYVPPLSAPDLLTSTTRIVLQGQELLTSNMMVRQRRGVEGENSSAGLASSHPVLVISVGLPDGDPETGCSVVESSSELVGW